MAKHWAEDHGLLASLTANLFDVLPLLPKRLVQVDVLAREFDMPFSQIQIISLLDNSEMAIGDISAHLGIAKPNITPLLDALDARGLVMRMRSAEDRRIVRVKLTAAGTELARAIQAQIAQQAASWPESCNVSDIKRLNNALATLITFADNLPSAPRV